MTPRLVATSGPLSGATVTLTHVETSVGHDDSNELVLVDPSVSPRHCVLVWREGRLRIVDADQGNPTFVNGLPAGDREIKDGDRIQVGTCVFRVQLADEARDEPVRSAFVTEAVLAPTFATILRREDVLVDGVFHRTAPAARLSRDLSALIRISAAINAVRGLVALERPLLELIADVLPATQGAIVLAGGHAVDVAAAVGWQRHGDVHPPVLVNRSIVDRVMREVVGVLVDDPGTPESTGTPGPSTRSVIAAPLVAFDKVIGAIVLENDRQQDRFDEGHLRLLIAIAGVAATALEHAREVERLEGANRRLREELHISHNMVGESERMRDVYRRVARVAPTDSTVLITGESGTGKELIARAIHRNSPRMDRPFVAINCAAITETLLESELFGHEKGAFTGAIAQKRGKLELANGGVVFLDEIGELSQALQAKLLRVLQEREFDRVGGTKSVRVDFRLIAATNRDLDSAIANGTFRRDLYYRLNVVSLSTPPLRERREDIVLLASWFLRRHIEKARRQVVGFSPEALACLTAYEWPGNVRELENAI